VGVEADPAKAADWKTERVIRSDRLKWLCTDPAASELVSPRGISIIGARIDSVLNLQWARVTYPLQMRRCAFTEKLILEGSHLCSLNLQATFVKDLAAAGLNVDESVTMNDGFKAEGKVEIMNATIGGNFECDAGQFTGAEGIALDARSAKIGSNVSLGQARLDGGVDFSGATIGGIFQCDGAQFINSKGRSLNLDSVKIDRNLFLRKANFQGEVWLYNAIIGGNFECTGGTFTGSENGALDACSAKIGSNVYLNASFAATRKVAVVLQAATIGGDLICSGGTFAGSENGALNANSVKIGSNASLGQARFEGEVNFGGATIGGNLACDGGTFANKKGYALNFDSAKIDRNVFLRNHASFEGGVWLYNAWIGGNFECSHSTFKGFEKEPALDATSAKIGSDVSLNYSTCEATAYVAVTFREATIGGDLNCSGGQFSNAEGPALEANSATISGNLACDGGTFANKKGYALSFDSAKIGRNVFLRNHASFEGGVWLYNAWIGGDFECDAGQFTGSQDDALNASSAKIGSKVSLGQARFEGGVDFSGATISGIFACDEAKFTNARGRSLSLDSVKIDRNLFLRKANFQGEVWLYNAIIGGNFECAGATFTGSANGALDATSAKIGSDVYLNASFAATRKVAVVFRAATIGGDLICSRGTFAGSENGALSASSAKIGSNASLGQARFEGEVNFGGATIGGNLACDGGTFANKKGYALNFDSVKIDRNLFLRKANFQGEVWLYNANIGGDFECDAGQFTGSQDDALNASAAKIGSKVSLGEARFEGEVDFGGATISGNLACDGGTFANKKGYALSFDSAKIDRNVFLRNHATFEGGVWLYNAWIGGNFECSRSTFKGFEKEPALDATSAKIGSDVYLNEGFAAEGAVKFENGRVGHIFVLKEIGRSDRFILDLRFAKVGSLLNEKNSWPKPGNLRLHGFVYDVIDEAARPEDDRIQVQWLHRQQPDQFLSQPYEQLAATLRGMGLQEEAVNVMIAKNRDEGRHSKGPLNWFWYHVFGKLIGYGYRPWPALLVSVVIIAIGTFLFKLGYESEIIIPTSDNAYRVGTRGKQRLKGTYPKFNALIYSLEAFVPLVKLAVEQYWIPSANCGGTIRAGKLVLTRTGGLLRCYLWFHIIAGWILTTLWVGGFTGLLKT
jgi:hypothetical protein